MQRISAQPMASAKAGALADVALRAAIDDLQHSRANPIWRRASAQCSSHVNVPAFEQLRQPERLMPSLPL
jgi:hypothetical protein